MLLKAVETLNAIAGFEQPRPSKARENCGSLSPEHHDDVIADSSAIHLDLNELSSLLDRVFRGLEHPHNS